MSSSEFKKLREYNDSALEKVFNDPRIVYIFPPQKEKPEEIHYIGFEEEEPIITNDDWALNLSLDEDKNE